MRVFLCATIFIVAVHGTPSGKFLCKLDAANACRDYSTASKCLTTDYCKAEIWSRPVNNGTVICQMCLDDISNLQKFVDAGSTRQFVKYNLLSLCRAIPFAQLRDECKSLIDEKFSEIYQDLVNELNPSVICQALRLCHSKDSYEVTARGVIMSKIKALAAPRLLELIPADVCKSPKRCDNYSTARKCGIVDTCKAFVWSAPTKNDEICDFCKEEIKKLQDWVRNSKTRDEVKKELLVFCDGIPLSEFQQQCHGLVEKDFDLIYDDLIAALNPDMMCTALQFCTAMYSENILQVSCDLNGDNACLDYSTAGRCKTLNYCKAAVWNQPVQNNELCDMCMQDVKSMQKFLDSNSTREYVQAELLAMCKMFPWADLRFRCQSLVIQNFEDIYDDIVNFLDANTVCRALFFCRSKGERDVFSEISLLKKEQKSTLCTLDSENGCRDYGTAKRCDMLPTCKVTIWSGPTNDDQLCQMCKDEVAKIQSWIEKKGTRDIVRKELDMICDKIPFSAFRDECKELVSNNFDDIYDDVIALLDPSTVCTAMKLCQQVAIEKYVKGMMDKLPGMLQKALEDKKLPATVPFALVETCPLNTQNACRDYTTARACNAMQKCKEEVWSRPTAETDVCTMCKNDIVALQNKFNASREMVRTSLNNLCQKITLEKLRDECLKLVKDDLDVIYNDILYLLKPEAICSALRLCSAIDDQMPGIKSTLNAARTCTDCETFMQDFQNTILNNKKVVNDWISMLKTECDALGEGIGTLCKENVDMLVYEVMSRHKNNKDDSKTICQDIMMCDSFVQKQRMGDMCTDCKTFFKDWQDKLKNNPDLIDKVVRAISQFYCLQKPEKERDQCSRYVSMVIKVLIVKMEYEDVGEVCTRLEFCGDKAPVKTIDIKAFAKRVSKVILQNLPKHKPQLGGNTCTDCKNFVTDLQDVIKNNGSLVQELVDLVKQECDQLGPELSEVCIVLVNTNYAEVLKKFELYDADTICVTIKMCIEQTQKAGGDLCTDCVAFFGDWQQIIANNQSIIDGDLAAMKQAICSQVPEFLKHECEKVFDEDSRKFIEAIAKCDPEEVCATLYFCDATTVQNHLAVQSQKKVGGELECQACRFVIEEVEKMVENNRTEEAIASALQEVCELYGEDIRDECKAFMKEYSADVIDFLLLEMNSLEICSKLGLCEEAKKFELQKSETVKIPGLCTLCESVMRYVDGLVDFNATEEAIMNELDHACDALKQYRDECRGFVDHYGRYIVDILLKEGTSPLLVCKTLALCSNPPILEVSSQNVQGEVECDFCLALLSAVDDVLNDNATEAEILDVLATVCSRLGKYDDECNTIIHEYGPTIIHLFTQELPPSEICALIKACTTGKEKVKARIAASDLECEVCTLIAKELDKLLEENSTQAEIVEALKEVCSLLPKDFKDTCDGLVTQYFAEIVQILIEEMRPENICVQLALCPQLRKPSNGEICEICKNIAQRLHDMLADNSTEKAIEQALKRVCMLMPEEMRDTCDGIISQYFEELVRVLLKELDPSVICADLRLCPAEVKKVSSDVSCELCELVTSELDSLLKENATQEEIEAALMEVCTILPSSVKEECNSLINQYGSTIIDLLVAELSPEKICPAINLCPKSNAKQQVKASNITCEVCELVATELDNLLKEDATQEEIEKALMEVCSILPSSVKDECDSLISQYGPTIVDLLVAEMAPGKICPDIGLCPKSNANARVKQVKQTTECDICLIVMKELENLLSQKSTDDEIIATVNRVCEIVPQKYREDCHQYINDYGPGVISILINDFVPRKVCTLLGLCRDQNLVFPPMKLHVGTDEKCAICKRVITVLDEILEDNVTESALEKALQRVCNYMPASLVSECDSMIAQYAPIIFQYVDKIGDPGFICQHLKLCPSDLSNPIPGSDPCSFGPSYWCRDRETAEKCNALSHCMNHVWD